MRIRTMQRGDPHCGGLVILLHHQVPISHSPCVQEFIYEAKGAKGSPKIKCPPSLMNPKHKKHNCTGLTVSWMKREWDRYRGSFIRCISYKELVGWMTMIFYVVLLCHESRVFYNDSDDLLLADLGYDDQAQQRSTESQVILQCTSVCASTDALCDHTLIIRRDWERIRRMTNGITYCLRHGTF